MVIPGAEEEEYQLTLDDVDSCLVYMYTPVTEENAKGEPQYAITDFIKAGSWMIRVTLSLVLTALLLISYTIVTNLQLNHMFIKL